MLIAMRLYLILLALVIAVQAAVFQNAEAPQNRTVSSELFAELEELSRLVAISYCVGYQGIQKPFTCLSHCSEFPGLELVQTFDTGILSNSCGYIALSHTPAYPPRILVIFRGTNSVSNFLSDLQTSPTDYIPYATTHGRQCTNCTVHSGFMRAWNATREVILPQLQVLRQQYPRYPIVFAGHSMGGAVAGIGGLELKSARDIWGKTGVVSFGEPMFGNAGMARFVDENFGCWDTTAEHENCTYKRVTHAQDPVPLLPPAEWGWRQHGSEIFISKPGLPPIAEDMRLCSGPKDPACLDGDGELKEAAASSAIAQKIIARADGTIDGVVKRGLVPPRWQIWQLLFAHREYIWRLGLCYDPDWPWDDRQAPPVPTNYEL